MTAPHLGPGHTVAGKYTIRALMGFTGEVATYHAAASSGHEVVIKLYDPALGQRADVMSQLERVRAQVQQLPPQSVVPVIDAGYDVGTSAPFTVGEYLQIPSVARLVETGPLSPEVVARILLGMAQVLGAAHAQGLFHLALKPTNVFVGAAPNYPVRVTDFGASVVRRTSPTHESYALSAPWWAPEQLQPAAVLGPPADVFAAALIGFYALTGRSYWLSCQQSPPDLPAWQMEVMGQRVPASRRAGELGATVNPIVDGVFGRALSVNQPDRPQTLMELANALSSAGGYMPRDDSPKTMAFEAMPVGGGGGGGGYPHAQQGYAPSPAFGAPQDGGQYTATASAGTRPQPAAAQYPHGQAADQVTPGLPPFPQAPKPKKNRTMPIVIGIIAAALVGTALVVLLFVTGDGETNNKPTASASSSASDDETGGAQPSASATAAGETDATGEGGAPAPEGKTVDVSIKCTPACDELYIDAEKVADPTATQKLLVGKHTVKAIAKGYYPRSETIDVPADKALVIEYTLAKIGQAKPTTPNPCGQFLKPCK